MTLQALWHFIERALGVFGGITVIAIGMSRWIGSIWLSRATEKYRLDAAKELKN